MGEIIAFHLQAAGWLLGLVLLLFLALTSYITATWVIEAMAACNGILSVERSCQLHRGRDKDDEDEEEEDVQPYSMFDDDDENEDTEYLVRCEIGPA